MILFLAVVAGLSLGSWLAIWVVRTVVTVTPGAESGAERIGLLEREAGFGILQVLLAGTPPAPLEVPQPDAETRYPKILLVALPTFEPPRRAFLFIRPADPKLCRSLQGIELAVTWLGSEPVGLCAVSDPPRYSPATPAVEFAPRRSS